MGSNKQIIDREKSAVALLAIIEGQLEALVEASSQALSPYLQGGALPDLKRVYELAGLAVQQSLDTMRAADQAHINEQNDCVPILDERDTKAEALFDGLVDLRQTALSAYGEAALVPLGFSVPTPQDPMALIRLARGITANFRRSTPATKDDILFDPKSRLEAIDKDAAKLEELFKKAAKARRKLQKTQDDKNKSMAAYDVAFSRAANFFVGAFRLAGLESLAKKVRPSSRRPGQLLPETEPETEPETKLDSNKTP